MKKKNCKACWKKNYSLLAGDQINPDDPLRWLLIKREMPVPDPTTGLKTWSIDLFFVDHNARPTFVECKRYLNTQSRREIVGQMLDYAANAKYYWDKDELKNHAGETALKTNEKLEDVIDALLLDNQVDIDSFFEQVEYNIKEGHVRLIFFLEEAPVPLKTVVEFLNNQMELSEVLVVEAKQYKDNGIHVVVPTLYGYTEEARIVKKPARVIDTDMRAPLPLESILEELLKNQNAKSIIDFARKHPNIIKIVAGAGIDDPSVKFQASNNKSILFFTFSGKVLFTAATGMKNQFGMVKNAYEEHLSSFEFRSGFHPGKQPSLKKNLKDLSEGEVDNINNFMLHIAQAIS